MTLARMLQLMAGSLGLRVLGAGLGFATQLVLARTFSQSDMGVIFLTMSLAAIFSMIAAVGYPLLALTQLPRFFALNVNSLVRAFHGTFLRDLVAGLALVLLITVICLYALPLSEGTKIAILFGALSALPSAIVRYNSVLANGMRLYQWAYVPDFILRPSLFLLYVLIGLLFPSALSVLLVLAVYVGSNVLVAALQSFVVRAKGISLQDWNMTRPALTRALRRRSMALAIVGAVTVMFADIVTTLGGWFLPHEKLAILALTVRLAAIAGFVVQAAQQFVLPDLTEALAKQESAKADNLLLRLNMLTGLTLALGLVFALVFGGWLLSLFGANYTDGHLLLVLFLIGQSIRALSGMNQNLISIAGKQMRSAMASLMGLVIFASSWALLQNVYGLNAAGYAVIIAELSWAFTLANQAQSILGRRGDLFWLFLKR